MSTLHPHPSAENNLVSHFKGKGMTYTRHRCQSYSVAHSISDTMRLLIRTQNLFYLYHSFPKMDNRYELYVHFAYSLGMRWTILEMKSQDASHPHGLYGPFQALLCPWSFRALFTEILLSFFRNFAMSDGRVCSWCGVSFQFDCLQKRQMYPICCLLLCPSKINLYLLQLCPVENCNYSYIKESRMYYSMCLHGCLRIFYINALSKGTIMLWKFSKFLCFLYQSNSSDFWKKLIFLWYCHKRAESWCVRAVTFSTTERIATYQLSCVTTVCTTCLQQMWDNSPNTVFSQVKSNDPSFITCQEYAHAQLSS